MRAPMTATRRGLALIAYSEAPLLAGLVAFLVRPSHPALLVGGIVLSLLIGAPAALALWLGRREFGPRHARGVARATVAFCVLFAALLFAFFGVTSVFPQSLRVRDLYGPWFFLALALAADASAILLLLGPLVHGRKRRWLSATGALGAAGLVAFLLRGWQTLAGLVARSGGVASVPAEATSYANDFVLTIVRDWAVAILLLRVGFLPALHAALLNVAEAEDEARAARADPDTAA